MKNPITTLIEDWKYSGDLLKSEIEEFVELGKQIREDIIVSLIFNFLKLASVAGWILIILYIL